MPRMGFQPTTLVSERGKTVHALNRAATVIGHIGKKIPYFCGAQRFITVIKEFR
jgi:hypothetical protein